MLCNLSTTKQCQFLCENASSLKQNRDIKACHIKELHAITDDYIVFNRENKLNIKMQVLTEQRDRKEVLILLLFTQYFF